MLKYFCRAMIVTVCSSLFCIAMQAQDSPPPPPPPPPTRDYPISEWKTFTSETWKFSALTPTTQAEETRAVKNTKQHFFKSFMSQHTFQISCYESDSELANLETAANNLRSTFLRGEGAKLLRDEKINLGSYQGHEMTVVISRSYEFGSPDRAATIKSLVQARTFVVERRIYLLIATCLNQDAETKEARAFLVSFKLLDKAETKKPAQPNSKNR